MSSAGGALAVGALLVLSSCHHGAATATPSSGEAGIETPEAEAPIAPRDPLVEDLWAKAADAELADLARLASAQTLAAVPRRARDPEDALELRQGCEALLLLARKPEAPKSRRARAVSTLRMLESTGCLHGDAEAPPSDLDPK